MKRAYTKYGRFAHYTRDGELTLCNFAVAATVDELSERLPKLAHRLREAPVCNRCNGAAGAEGVA